MILLALGWYLRFSLSYRDVEELLAERGLLVDHVTVWRWVQRYALQIQRRLRPRLRPTNDSWRVDSDLHPGQGQVGVFIPRGGLHRCDDRLLALGQMRCSSCRVLSRQSLGRRIRRRESSTPTSTPHIHPPSASEAPRRSVLVTVPELRTHFRDPVRFRLKQHV